MGLKATELGAKQLEDILVDVQNKMMPELEKLR